MSTHRYSIFGLICTPRLSDFRAGLLSEAVQRVTDWPMVLRTVVDHRIGPLLYWHLKEYGIQYPQEIRRTLAAMYARQRSIGRAQAQTLAEIVKSFTDAAITTVVIKGGALAHVIYGDPGLRPMEDLDILVNPEHANSAHKLLTEMGFRAPLPSSRFDRLQHHYPLAQRTRDDVTVSVELHTSAFNLLMRDRLSTENMMHPLHAYAVEGQRALTLNPVQMLWMQYLGMRKLAEPLRYIHLADLVGIAETLKDDIDWIRLRQTYPDLRNAFEAIHAFSPLSEAVQQRLELQGDTAPLMKNIGQDFCGWPKHGFGDKKNNHNRGHLIGQTLVPPEWWSRLVYGVRSSDSLASIYLYHHPSAFLHQGLRRLYLGPVNSLEFFKGAV